MHNLYICSRMKTGLNVVRMFRIVPFETNNHPFELRIGMKRNLRNVFNVSDFQIAKHFEYIRFGYARFHARNTYIRRHLYFCFWVLLYIGEQCLYPFL